MNNTAKSSGTIVALQMCSGIDANQNLQQLEQQLHQLPTTRPMLVCLPESFLIFAKHGKDALALAEQSAGYQARLATLCRKFDIWLAAGTMPIATNNNKYLAASLLFNSAGSVVAHYNKIHLFDVDVADGTGAYRESNFTQAGDDVVVVDSPFGKIGLTVCYDLRFSGLYSTLQRLGAEIILVPSAFTTVTGKAHWQPLLTARAIETQSYVIAAAQAGQHENGRSTYGHSLIISPWGEVLSELKSGTGFIGCQPDLAQLHAIRRDMPVQSHQRFREHLL
ncbi:carbon-nitrogen hydrolase family protein [Pseudoalteromonas shioyasakiensis]|uniref:carbon-nitrogen hydrolase family protein n=1 Tax=Pseudoalteromonas shioyasakiensis TaxID=1190813 RepID=UPI002117DE0D|nr:carbon-nitrogen hydrolase family protein [Pseudoalteromonas shioyasakiensis]MCQ8879143.1 carbon-nitrogen hydrolase family protein [Pseudoalteromonas shioyasakiensis]